MSIHNKAVLITGAQPGHRSSPRRRGLTRGAKRVYAGTRADMPISDKRVTPLTLDVTNTWQIQRAKDQVDNLDVLINNAGIALYDDLGSPEVIERHLAVNLIGVLNVTQAFLPLLKRSKGTIVNHLSLAGLVHCNLWPLADEGDPEGENHHEEIETDVSCVTCESVCRCRSRPSTEVPAG